MAEIVDTIREVETKQLPTGTVIYLIKTSGGKEVSTLKRDIAQEAYALVGTTTFAHIDYTAKKNERGFTNNYLNELTVQQEETIAGPAPFGGQPGPSDPPPGLFDDTVPPSSDDRRELAIAKAVALKAAVDLMAYFEPQDRTSTNVTGVAEYFAMWLLEWHP
jgi:hypothetical protein